MRQAFLMLGTALLASLLTYTATQILSPSAPPSIERVANPDDARIKAVEAQFDELKHQLQELQSRIDSRPSKPPGKTEPRPSDGHPINNTPPATLDQEELVSAVTEAVLQRLPTSATIDQASLKELVDQVAEERKRAEATKRLEAQLAKDAKFRGEFMGRLKDNLLKVATDAAIRDADLPQIQAILTRRYDETLRIYGGGNKQDPDFDWQVAQEEYQRMITGSDEELHRFLSDEQTQKVMNDAFYRAYQK